MPPERPPLASVEAVREELKRLGYLESGLDRFVLAGAGSASPVRASLAAALRVGVAGGVVFGLAATVAAVGLDRRLLGELRDLPVLSLYLMAAAALGTGVLALGGGLAVAWARRRGHQPHPALARHVGFAVAVAGLAYLSFWWRSHLLGAPWAMQAAALVLGVGSSLILGRFGSLAAVAVLAAGGADDRRLPQAGLVRQHLVPVLVVAALLYGGGVAAASYFGRATPIEGPDFAVVPTGLRVRVLAIDGLERRMTEQMMARGEMPTLRDLLARGAHGRLNVEPERVPAIVWTTIATGRGPEAHGIQSTGARRIAGMRGPVLDDGRSPFTSALGAAADLLRLSQTQPPSAVLRTVKTFWNVASEKGLRVGIVNWWATWPADAVNGYLVSDRAFFKVEKGGPADRETWPAETLDELRDLVEPAPPSPSEPNGEGAAGRARRIDAFHAAAARRLRGSNPPDIEALYLPGLDIFTMQQLGEAAVADLASLDSRLDAVRSYYRFLDGVLAEVMAANGPLDVVVLVGDPGRLARAAPGGAEGTIVLAGGPIGTRDLGLVASRDVAPTVLHLVGLPRSEELSGRTLDAALRPDFLAAHPVRTVKSYGMRPRAGPTESAFDREMLEELKSLGYIQ